MVLGPSRSVQYFLDADTPTDTISQIRNIVNDLGITEEKELSAVREYVGRTWWLSELQAIA